MLQSWDELRRSARTAERQLEEKIAAYKDISREAGAKRGDQFDEGLCACWPGSLANGRKE